MVGARLPVCGGRSFLKDGGADSMQKMIAGEDVVQLYF